MPTVAAEAATLAARRDPNRPAPDAWFAGVDRLLGALEGFDLTPRLARIRCRSLVLLAADDRIMDGGARARARRRRSAPRSPSTPRLGHALVVEDPDWVANACLAFFERQEIG